VHQIVKPSLKFASIVNLFCCISNCWALLKLHFFWGSSLYYCCKTTNLFLLALKLFNNPLINHMLWTKFWKYEGMGWKHLQTWVLLGWPGLV
jgi:hypothetical protein